jgi:hypothetical protein
MAPSLVYGHKSTYPTRIPRRPIRLSYTLSLARLGRAIKRLDLAMPGETTDARLALRHLVQAYHDHEARLVERGLVIADALDGELNEALEDIVDELARRGKRMARSALGKRVPLIQARRR